MTAAPPNDALLAELAALYEEVDALYADWSCPGSTECCRFGIAGRQPFLTSIEALAVSRALARRGGPRAASKRALPLTSDVKHERICPLLDEKQRCSIYADRPLGCRTFYCGRATRGAGPDGAQLSELVARLHDLAARHRLGGELSRPITRVLDD